jgi:hypothetical protein
MIYRWKKDLIEFSEVDPIEAELLRQIPDLCAVTDDPRIEERLFTEPADSTETEFIEDWNEYVKPELRHLFLSARKLVEVDLAGMEVSAKRGGKLLIPVAHGDAWLNTLNQARLILATRYNFTERELSSPHSPKSFSLRDLALWQIDFYALIQERIIDAFSD